MVWRMKPPTVRPFRDVDWENSSSEQIGHRIGPEIVAEVDDGICVEENHVVGGVASKRWSADQESSCAADKADDLKCDAADPFGCDLAQAAANGQLALGQASHLSNVDPGLCAQEFSHHGN